MRTQVGLLASVAVLAARTSSSQVPLGDEFQVNAHTTAQQSGARVAAQPGGAFVIAWDSVDQDGSAWGVFARRYDASGVPVTGEETQVNASTPDSQRFSSAAIDQAGNVVVVWVGYGANGFSNGIYARHYDATGTPGSEQRVSAHTTGSNTRPAVATAAGGFVVVWHGAGDGSGLGVLGRRLDSSGVLQGDEFIVNSQTTDHQWQPAVAGNSDGNFVVVWASGLQDGSTWGVFGQRFNASGATQGSEFAVNASTTGVQYQPAVGLDGDGNFVVVWMTYLQDGSKIRVEGQRFDAYAARQGDEWQISTHTLGDQDFPAVASASDGSFVVVWTNDGPIGSGSEISGRRYDRHGAPLGGEFQANSYATGLQVYPSVAADDRGRFVVAWTDARDQGSVFAQRFIADVLFGDGFQ